MEVKEKNNTSLNIEDHYANEISLDSAAYLEKNDTETQLEIHSNEKQLEGDRGLETAEQNTPQLFSEDDNIDSFKKEIETEKASESLINEDEEDNFEIPAFLRKQKN